MALSGSSEIDPPVVIGQRAGFSSGDTLLPGEQVYHLVRPSDSFDIPPNSDKMNRVVRCTSRSGPTNRRISTAGEQTSCASVSFNYDRKESDLRPTEIDEVVRGLQSTGRCGRQSVARSYTRHHPGRDGIQLWKYCILLALLFLAIEVALIRLIRT